MNKRFTYRYLQQSPFEDGKAVQTYGIINLDNIVDVKVHLILEQTEENSEPVPATHVYVYLGGMSTREYQVVTNPLTGEDEAQWVEVPYFIRITHPEDVEEFLGLRETRKRETPNGFWKFHSSPSQYIRSWLQGLIGPSLSSDNPEELQENE